MIVESLKDEALLTKTPGDLIKTNEVHSERRR